jgi:hypothetical protein
MFYVKHSEKPGLFFQARSSSNGKFIWTSKFSDAKIFSTYEEMQASGILRSKFARFYRLPGYEPNLED